MLYILDTPQPFLNSYDVFIKSCPLCGGVVNNAGPQPANKKPQTGQWPMRRLEKHCGALLCNTWC